MSQSSGGSGPRPTFDGVAANGKAAIDFLFENSAFLILGAASALLWANLDGPGYRELVSGSPLSGPAGGVLNLHFLVNDVFMAVFFGMAAKEVWEALLPGGPLSDPRRAATPLMATLGGVAMPAAVYLVGAATLGRMEDLGRGWAVPCATDIAFSYLLARLIFGPGHPAIAFLLLLAIADDAAGLAILAVFYPEEAVAPAWFLLSAAAVGLGLLMKARRVRSFWWYLLGPGVLCWWSFHEAGIHPALGLVPIIPTMPHLPDDRGLFAHSDPRRRSTLDRFGHWWGRPAELILGLFGLVNAGVPLGSVGTATWLVLLGLVVGKPLGITLFTAVGEAAFGLKRPEGMGYRHVLVMGIVAGIGFTVALFVSTAAFPEPGPLQDSAKMGALGSFLSAAIALPVARVLRIRSGSAPSPGQDGGPSPSGSTPSPVDSGGMAAQGREAARR
ncbi:Na+/H+ antiporter NhaA [Tautonia plasticadhaerens]|uniref:Na(+)/H(+) antiporter NhaA n=1 Tax=Tautonia plasticadhaerens TaxID=2527974 RepID=A0A518HDL5_9BACT|nr:Na+/H+ antiporter NhaA [Tautonia plasticadhaerens]QDV38951.1 Na(+)/H(+) antiporter NhaA [Tautonia plasticadhaerens]